MSKIIFLDIDGTLVDYENNLPESAVTAIRRARANGHRVYLCSGRSRAEIYPNLWEIGVDGLIGGNGSYVEDHEEVVMHQLITKEQCEHIVSWLHERGLEFYLESNNGLFASENFETGGLHAVQEYSRRKGKNNADQITVRSAFPDMIFGGELIRDDLNKVSFALSSYQDYLDAVEEFPDLKAGTWGGVDEKALFGDLGLKEISKATAVNALLDYIGGSIEDTIAFGDAKVDIPMLACCNLGVAMGNGGDEIKAMADMICGDVTEDGLFHAFEELELI